MNGIVDLPLFIISSTILVMAPGPDFFYVTTRGMSEGHRAGILSAFGISSGLLVHTLFAALGLSALIQASWFAYEFIRYAGAAYLIYLGVRALLKKDSFNINKKPASFKNGSIYGQGVLTNVFNPKAIIVFMAFLPQFVLIKNGSHVMEFVILGLILSFIAAAWFSLIGYFAGVAGEKIKQSKQIRLGIEYLSGSVLIGLGLRLALKKQ